MKRILLISLAAICCMSVLARKAFLKVEYAETYTNWTGANVNNDFLLLVGEEESRYYNPMTQVVDSMLSTPQGTAQFNSMVEAANTAGQRPSLLPKSRTYVIKDHKTNTIHYYGEAAGELGNYCEPAAEQTWALGDTTKTVLGYECILAETDYHGRHWKAWFSPEIPVPDGPWKLCGLSGLILEATADGGAYNFTATGIETVDVNMPERIYGHDLSEKTDRKQMLLTTWDFYNNSAAQMNAQFGISMTDDPLPEGFDLIETDYK